MWATRSQMRPEHPPSHVVDLGPQAPLGPAVSPASAGVCSFLGPHPQPQPPPCPLAPGGAGGPWAQLLAWGAAELKGGPAAGRRRKRLGQLVHSPHPRVFPICLAGPHLGIPGGNSPLWELGPLFVLLPVLRGWAGALAAVVGGTLFSWGMGREEKLQERHSCIALPDLHPSEALKARTFPLQAYLLLSAPDVPFRSSVSVSLVWSLGLS